MKMKLGIILGLILFSPPFLVNGETNWTEMVPINLRENITYSHPAFLPYTFSSRPDLFIGSADGTLYHQPTLSTNSTAIEFADFEAGLITAIFPRGAPFSHDFNKDGLLDILVGDQNGKVHLLLQTNTGNFVLNDSLITGVEVSEYAKPTMGDLDGDQKEEIIVGEGNGSLVVFFNIGTVSEPSWVENREIFNFPLGAHPSPFAFKATNDATSSDLVIGTERFGIIYVKNLSDESGLQFDVIQFTNGGNPFQTLNFEDSSFLTPALADLDNDGNLDLAVGTKEGKIHFFKNLGVSFETVQSQAELLNQTLILVLLILLVLVSAIAVIFYFRSRVERGRPIYLMLVHSSGITPFSFSFGKTEVEDDALAGGAFVGVSSIINEITRGSLESLDIGDRKILVTRVSFNTGDGSELIVLLWASNDDPKLRRLAKELGTYVAKNFEEIFTMGEITDEFRFKTEAKIETLFQEFLEGN